MALKEMLLASESRGSHRPRLRSVAASNPLRQQGKSPTGFRKMNSCYSGSTTKRTLVHFLRKELFSISLPSIHPSQTRHSSSRSEEHTSELQSLRHLVCR